MSTPLLSDEDRAEVLRIFSDLKTKYGTLDAALTAGKPTGEIKTAIEKMTGDVVAIQEKYQQLAARADAIEEKQRQKPAELEPPKALGEQFIEDKGFLSFVKQGGRGSYTAVLKGPLFAKDIVGLSRVFGEMAIPRVAVGARVPIGVRTLVPQGRTTAGAVQYIEETSFTNNAAPVAEQAPKPKSEKVFTPKTLPVETIAHYFKMSRQTFDDLPFVSAQVENNGIWGVQKVEDDQLLNGNGASPNLKGFMSVATPAPGYTGTGGTVVDSIGAAAFDLAAKGYIPDGAVVNPGDWGQVALLKNTLGNYIFANPLDYSPIGRLWGMRMVQSSNMAPGAFLVGAFQGNSQILDREDVNVQIATQNEDDFIKNMVTILVEERLVLVIFIAAAFEKGTVPAGAFTAPATAATPEEGTPAARRR